MKGTPLVMAMDSIPFAAIPSMRVAGDGGISRVPVQIPHKTMWQHGGSFSSPSGSGQGNLRCSLSRGSIVLLARKQQVKTVNRRRRPHGISCAINNVDMGGAAGSISTSSSEERIEDMKRAVMRAVSNTNRGKATTYQQRQSTLKLLEELEELNPNADPSDSLLSGHWALLYTAPTDEVTADKYAGAEEGPFLARVKPAAFGSVRQVRSTQVIDSSEGIASNIAEFIAFGVSGSLNIKASVTKEALRPKGVARSGVTFESFVLKFGNWKSPTISLGWIRPKGWVDTTFVDKDMLIGHGDKGSIFLAVRINEN